MIHWLNSFADPLPPTAKALPADSEAPGLLAAGGELSPERLREAYSRGVFPWYSEGQPVLWWSPDPRMLLKVDQFRLSHSLRKTVRRFARSPGCEVRVDADIRAVIASCAGMPRAGQDGTWIVSEMVEAYLSWHQLGAVHSFEARVDDELIGGLYGVCIGRMFFGESMFARRTDASKIAVAALVAFCRARGISWIDCQQRTAHLQSLGAREVPRAEFETGLAERVAQPEITDWRFEPSMWQQLEVTARAPSEGQS